MKDQCDNCNGEYTYVSLTLRELKWSASQCSYCALFFKSLKAWDDLDENNLDRDVEVGLWNGESIWLEEGRLELYTLLNSPRLHEIKQRRHFPSSTWSEECQNLTKEWILWCNKSHPDCRQPEGPCLPTRVLDVRLDGDGDPFLFESHRAQGKYAALSHCWGKFQPLTTTNSTLNDRKRGIPWHELPLTFKDAIQVTRDLGLDYLWIDSLCIIQDSDEDWQNESKSMGSIYGSAWVTIAATCSEDSSKGLLRSNDRPFVGPFQVDGSEAEIYARREIEHRTFEGHDQSSVEEKRGTPLSSRAWTLQEHLLASRVIQFAQHEIVWECRSEERCFCSENDASEIAAKRNFFASANDPTTTPEESLNAWYDTLQNYRHRAMTKSKDWLPAFSGIAQTFQPKVGGRYLGGLWDRDLLHGVSWFPTSSSRLRKKPARYQAPSWSWVAIDGAILVESVPSNLDKRVEFLECECVPATKDWAGQVKSGHITLRGYVISLGAYFFRTGYGFSRGTRYVSIGGETFVLDPDYILEEPGEHFVSLSDEIFGLLLWCNETTLFLVVLRRVADQLEVYKRIGHIYMDVRRSSSHKSEIYTIVSQFNKVAEKEIKII